MTTVKGESFVVAGVSARVRNDDPAAIGALWEMFRAGDLRSQIGEAASRDIYCVYHEYEGGHTDPYRMTIGFRVPPAAEIPEGWRRAQVPAQTLAVFTAQGPQPQALMAQWQAIWESDVDRRFEADHDLYHADRPDLVTIHVGVTGL